MKNAPSVIAFDVFGTVVDFSGVDREEIRDYARQVRAEEWSPLVLPESWETLPAYPDSRMGLMMLSEGFTVVTCSNGPLGLLAKISKNAGLVWDAIIPLELSRKYKPHPDAYLTVCEVLDVPAADVLLVTANPTFGDIEGAGAVGMQTQVIRKPDSPATIPELARMLYEKRT